MGRHRNYGGQGPTNPEPTDSMLQTTTRLTPAQIKTLVGSPVELVPAPGVARAIQMQSVVVSFEAGSAQYVGIRSLWVSVGPVANDHAVDLGLNAVVTGATDQVSEQNVGFLNVDPAATADYANQPVYLSVKVDNFTTGDGTLAVTMYYVIAPLN